MQPHIILVDLWIPEIGGEKAIEIIMQNESTKQTHVLIVSANADIKDNCRKVKSMKKYFAILLLIIGISCSGDEENLEPTDINLVTGIYIKEFQEALPMRLGNPNHFNQDQFVIYPNPVKDNLKLKSTETMTEIWVLPATASKSYKGTNFQQLLNSDLYSENTISDKSVLQFEDLVWSEIALDIESLNPGYYKVFVKINGNIYWDNIYVSNDNFDINDLINYWK